MQKSNFILKSVFPALLILFLFDACNNSSTGETSDLSKYTIVSIPGSDLQKATFSNKDGFILEQGYVLDGMKEGQWSYYGTSGEVLLKIENYHQGLLFGHVLELNPRFELTKRALHVSGKQDGYFAEYKRSRKKKEGYYNKGVRHGRQTQYHDYSDKILSEADYQEGKQHGIYKYYDDKGNVTLDYLYENGEKVSGGISK